MNLAPHDIACLVEQAERKEALADPIKCPRDPSWREHLIDAAEAWERVGRREDAARCLAAARAAEDEAAEEAPAEPRHEADRAERGRKRR